MCKRAQERAGRASRAAALVRPEGMGRSRAVDWEYMRARLSLCAAVVGLASVVDVVVKTRAGGRGHPQRGRGWGRELDHELGRLSAIVRSQRLPRVIETSAVANAGACSGQIFLNPQWMSATAQQICADDRPCRQALLRGLAAHELSHAVRRDSSLAPHAEELTADAWAGYLLGRTGTELGPYLELVGSGSSSGSATHPPSHQRTSVTRAAASVGSAEEAGACCDRCPPDRAAEAASE